MKQDKIKPVQMALSGGGGGGAGQGGAASEAVSEYGGNVEQLGMDDQVKSAIKRSADLLTQQALLSLLQAGIPITEDLVDVHYKSRGLLRAADKTDWTASLKANTAKAYQQALAEIEAALKGAVGSGTTKASSVEKTAQAPGLNDRIKQIIDTSGDPQTAEALTELANAGVSLDPSYVDMNYDGRSALFGLKNVENRTKYVTTLKPQIRKQYQNALAEIQATESAFGGTLSPQDKRKIFVAHLKKGGR